MKFTHVEELSDVERIVSRTLETKAPYALDIETAGLNPWRDSIVGMSLAYSGKGAVYIPLGHLYGQPFDPEQALRLLQPMLERVPSLIYNIPFDAEFLYRTGITVHPDSIDVSLLTYVNGTEVVNKLSYHAKNLLGMKVEDYKNFMARVDLPKKTHTIAEAPIRFVAEYCGRDAVATFLLWELLYSKLKNNGIYKLEHELLPVTMLMRRNGVLINRSHFETEAVRIKKEREHLTNLIWQQASEAVGEQLEFNIGSGAQVADVLFNKMKLPVTKRSKKTKAPSTAEGALAQIKWDYPIAANVISHRGMGKSLTSYLSKFPGLIEKDERIHTSLNQTGVVSGRYSSSDPNLQNIPNFKEWLIQGDGAEKVVVNTRDAFIVPEGWEWWSFDYSQIEARLAAGVTKEHILLDAFREGVDFHTKTTSLVFGIPVEQVTKTQRYLGKKLNFLLLYGGEAKRLYEELIKEMKVTYAECKKYRDLYYEAYPKMFSEAEKIGKDAYMTHSVQTLFGRTIPVPDLHSSDKYIRSHGERQAYNGVIQGSAADILKRALVKKFHMIKKDYSLDLIKPILTVHDELDYEVSPEIPKVEYARDSLEILKYQMDGFPELFCDVSVGDKWGSIKEIKDIEKELGDGKVSVVVPESVGKTFILEIPPLEVVTRTKGELGELKAMLTRKGGNTVILKGIGKDIIFSSSGISIEDHDKLILMTNGKFYEKPSKEDLKNL